MGCDEVRTVGGRSVTEHVGRQAGRDVRPSQWERTTRDRVIAGEEGALNEIYDQFASFVYGLALRVIGDARAAEDVSQDVFVTFWERPDAFDPDRGSLLPTVSVSSTPAMRRRPKRSRDFAVPSGMSE